MAVKKRSREDWLHLGSSIAIMLVAAGSALAGPRGMWLSDGVGLCAVPPGIQRHPGLASASISSRDMTADALDPLIHVPARLQIMATLAALPDGDALWFTRLQDMIGLTPGNLITHLRKLEEADYLTSEKTGSGPASRTSVALTLRGRAAFDLYTETLRGLLNGP
jgi:DNA-binding MarR family transcriptional regulator